LFDVETAPHSAYRIGGRKYVVVNIKIVNTRNGEVLFQASSNFGVVYNDPRKYGYREISDGHAPTLTRGAYFVLSHQLAYAMGDVFAGLKFESGTNVVVETLAGSVSDGAGIKKGDKIIGINDKEVFAFRDFVALVDGKTIKQGDEVVVKIERDGKTMERRMKFPLIPFRSEKKGDKLRDQGPVEEPQKEAPKTAIF
jgi:predicted metalloprotease with PDZ domain